MADDLLQENDPPDRAFRQFKDPGQDRGDLDGRILEGVLFLCVLLLTCLYILFIRPGIMGILFGRLFPCVFGGGLYIGGILSDAFRPLRCFAALALFFQNSRVKRIPAVLSDLPVRLFGLAHISRDPLSRPYFSLEEGADVQALVPDKGEGPGVVHGHGSQHGKDFVFKKLLNKFLFFFCQVFITADDLQTILFETGHQLLIVGRILPLHKLMGLRQEGIELLLGCHAGNIPLFISRIDHILQGCHPDHKKFIEVGGRDAQELEALKQGIVLVSRLAQTSPVKFEPAQFPVLIILRICIFYLLICHV